MKNLSSQKGTAPIIAIIVLTVILVGAGIYYFGRCQFPTRCLASTPVAKDATANWKTLNFPAYGIQFSTPPIQKEYPVTNDYNPQKLNMMPAGIPKECEAYGYYHATFIFDTKSFYGMEITLKAMTQDVDLQSWFNNCEKYQKQPILTETSINGQKVFVARDRNRTGNSGMSDFDQYIFMQNRIGYILSFENHVKEPGGEQQVEKILKSVKFSKPTIKL